MTHNLCYGQEEIIHRFLDGELPPTEQNSFRVHLESCKACRMLLTQQQTLFTELTTLETEAPPPEIADRIMANLPKPDAVPADCANQEEAIHRFIDEELPASEQATFRIHLKSCPTCREQLTQQQALWTKLSTLEEVTAPANITERVIATLPKPVSPRTNLIGQMILALQIAIGLGLLLTFLPQTSPTLDTSQLWLPWLTISEMGYSMTAWGEDFLAYSKEWLTIWLQLIQSSEPALSPTFVIAIVTGLTLAWLIGNSLLLTRNPPLFKNGGAR